MIVHHLENVVPVQQAGVGTEVHALMPPTFSGLSSLLL